MIKSLATFLDNIWNPYGFIFVILLMVGLLYVQITPFLNYMKPGKKNQKIVWTCPECNMSGTMYFREYGYGDNLSISYSHTETSPFCDGKGFSAEFSDMSLTEIQQQNKSARERIER